jgi:hypothetical protein
MADLKVMSFQESQQGPLFTNLLAATLESPFLLSLAGHLYLRYCFLSLQSCLKMIVIQINLHSAYRVILRYYGLHPLVKTDERML